MRQALAAFALLASSPVAAQLSAAETRIAATIEAERDRTIALLRRLVEQNSGTLNLAGVKATADLVRPELEGLGFAVEWLDMAATGRAGHLVATHKGNGRGKRMLLIGHLDTVFEPSSPFQGWKREGDRVTGPGVIDDKGGIAVIVAALRGMKGAGTLKGADIKIVLTGDEERVGAPLATARAALIEAGKWADVALEFEGLAREGGKDFGTVARRGSVNWTLSVMGKTGHSAGVFGPEIGYGAIYETARILDSWRRELIEPNLTFNVGVVGGGTPAAIDKDKLNVTASGKTNIIAQSAIARGDLRALTPEQEARARTHMAEIAGSSLAGTSATLTIEDGYPPMAPTAGNRALLARLNGVNRAMGLPEMPEFDPAKRGAADSSFVAADADTLAGMGPAGGNSHAEGEWLDLTTIPLQAKRAALLMSELAKARR